MVMTDANALFCDVSTRPVNFGGGWLVGWLLARFLAHMCHVLCVCVCVCVLSSVSGNPYLSLISSMSSLISPISPGWYRCRDQGPGAQHSFVCTPRCTCPYEYRMMDDVCACVCA